MSAGKFEQISSNAYANGVSVDGVLQSEIDPTKRGAKHWRKGAKITLTIRRPDYETEKEQFKLTENWGIPVAESYLRTMLAQAAARISRGQTALPPDDEMRADNPAPRDRKSVTNRWGHKLKVGTLITTGYSGEFSRAIVTRFDTSSDYAKAYGPRVYFVSDKLGIEGGELSAGIDDVQPLTAARDATTRPANKNPAPRMAFGLYARKGSGPRMHYDGRKFSTNGKPKRFYTTDEAATVGRELLATFPILKGYVVEVAPIPTKRGERQALADLRRAERAAGKL